MVQSYKRRKFTEEEKRSILSDAALRGTSTVLFEHRLSYSVFSRWKEKYQAEQPGEQMSRSSMKKRLQDLTAENELLKKIIASQALEIQMEKEKAKDRKQEKQA